MNSIIISFLSLILCHLLCDVASYKILVVNPLPFRSHNNLGRGIADILHDANHEVTFITGFPSEQPKYQEVLLAMELFQIDPDLFKINNIMNESSMGIFSKLPALMLQGITESTFLSENIQRMLADDRKKFDLVILQYFANQAFVGFGVKYDCPVIVLSPVAMIHWLARLTGNPVSPATVPNTFLGYNANMNFGQRVANTLMAAVQELLGEIFVNSYQKKSYEKYFHEEAAKVPFSELPGKISAVFSNSHPSIGNARPLLPNVVEIGGYHIKENQTLPKEYQEILDKAKNGVIYFSMGSNLKSSDFSEQLKSDILKTLRKRKELVLWKYEEDLPNKPTNVIIRSWLPQQSILKHPNVKLFISHGGLLSTTEASSAGVPVLSIPIFGDQFMNARTTQERGCGILLEYSNITESSLTWALNEVIDNPRYTNTAKQVHKLFHDRPMKPRDLVVFYSEHVIRTGGAGHLSTPRLPLYSLLLLDVFAVILIPVSIVFATLFWICKKCYRKTSNNKRSKNKNE